MGGVPGLGIPLGSKSIENENGGGELSFLDYMLVGTVGFPYLFLIYYLRHVRVQF